jgi:hypothetical protein
MHACQAAFLKAITYWDPGPNRLPMTARHHRQHQLFMNVPVTPEGG